MSETAGDRARRDLRQRGLVYFQDVLETIRRLPHAGVRAALAVAAAHQLVQRQVLGGSADAVDRRCAEAVDSMWRVLGVWPERPDRASSAWLRRLREEPTEIADRDAVAATIYAAGAI